MLTVVVAAPVDAAVAAVAAVVAFVVAHHKIAAVETK